MGFGLSCVSIQTNQKGTEPVAGRTHMGITCSLSPCLILGKVLFSTFPAFAYRKGAKELRLL